MACIEAYQFNNKKILPVPNYGIDFYKNVLIRDGYFK